MKHHLSTAFFYAFIIYCLSACQSTPKVPVYQDYEIASKWAEMTLRITKNTPSNSPTYASRCLGYIGLTMYEAAVHGHKNYNSLVGQLNELEVLALPEEEKIYDWRLSLNAAQASILKAIYNQTSDENKASIDSLEAAILENIGSHIEERAAIERSIAYGQSIAKSIFEWSKTDGGHRAYLKNFDKTWTHPERPGSWKPPLFAQSFSHHPLHPHWGKNRTFLKENAQLAIPKMIPYDTTKGSPYYQQFLAVYEKDLALTQAEKEAAIWWGDDPDETFTPPGHSYYIANLVVKDKQPNLIKCAETYARVGMAVADAFINCWKWKYHHFTERANTFIPQHIDQSWESFWPDPPFPSFPSGHAIQAASAAKVLIDLYGENFAFTDQSHIGRERDEVRDVDFVERSFSSFWEVALETADSRFYGGIHIPHDNAVGLEEGSRIAEHVNSLKWKR
ncbi:MAG: vanadium-dependent haloperoxidase [Bacteroidota bacterium]